MLLLLELVEFDLDLLLSLSFQALGTYILGLHTWLAGAHIGAGDVLLVAEGALGRFCHFFVFVVFYLPRYLVRTALAQAE